MIYNVYYLDSFLFKVQKGSFNVLIIIFSFDPKFGFVRHRSRVRKLLTDVYEVYEGDILKDYVLDWNLYLLTHR